MANLVKVGNKKLFNRHWLMLSSLEHFYKMKGLYFRDFSDCLAVWLSVFLTVCLAVWLSVFLTACLAVWLSVFLAIWLSVFLTVWLPVCLGRKNALLCSMNVHIQLVSTTVDIVSILFSLLSQPKST